MDYFKDISKSHANLLPGIWVSTITVEAGRVIQRLALSPFAIHASAGIALVVRFEDGFHQAWKLSRKQVEREVGSKLQWLITESEAMGVEVLELQLDYDCPVNKLKKWSTLLKALKEEDVLRKKSLWITSLPAHMEVGAYGNCFRDVVSGHILQLFDNGPDFEPGRTDSLLKALKEHGMEYRIGLGAYERTVKSVKHVSLTKPEAPRMTQHHEWVYKANVFKECFLFNGYWIFPAGTPYEESGLIGTLLQ